MKKELLKVEDIPAVSWGKSSDRIYIYVHGKMSRKEYAECFAEIAEEKGYQTFSEKSEHPFMGPEDAPIVDRWLYAKI